VEIVIPSKLVTACERKPERAEWLASLPNAIDALRTRWAIHLGPPFENASCAWVAPVEQNGRNAVLKVRMPHMEGADELLALQLWNGDPTVQIFDADQEWNAMLLEACEPGTPLRSLPEEDQDPIVAELLRRCWRPPSSPHPFRTLSTQLAYWAQEANTQSSWWPDAGLVREGLRLFQKLSIPSHEDVLLTTDLHAGNILRAQRAPWLVIDPKPFIGDRAYDVTQHLLNCHGRLRKDPSTLIGRIADLVGIERRRIELWLSPDWLLSHATIGMTGRLPWRDAS
jgi:streptomycin 6-kinase